ncbi:MAG: hypothetical protein QGG36_26435 [Pirellulaceae bacterium]|nr:hypothetical protein [Pirellulaceae bacterium]MDP7019363.1 hypothetical protein [Pirellulaceae bacterium]
MWSSSSKTDLWRYFYFFGVRREYDMAVASIQRIGDYVGMAVDGYRAKNSSDPVVQAKSRKHLIERMGRLRGLPQKLGQIISFTADDDRPTDEFSALQEGGELTTHFASSSSFVSTTSCTPCESNRSIWCFSKTC